MRLNLLIADFAYAGKQRVCLFAGPDATSSGETRGIVGRDAHICRMVIEDQTVSRRHFEILFADGKFWVRNLSQFGTLINGKSDLAQPGAKAPLENNDRIMAGETELLATILSDASAIDNPMAKPPPSPPERPQAQTTGDPLRKAAAMGAARAKSAHLTSERAAVTTPEEDPPAADSIKLSASEHPVSPHLSIPDDLDLEVLLGMVPAPDPVPAAAAPAAPRALPNDPLLAMQAQEKPAARVPPQRSAAVSGDATIIAILEAMGIESTEAARLAATVSPALIGELLASAIGAMTSQLMVRDSFKRMYHLSSTEIKSSGNNPLKLHMGGAEVLAELFDPPTGFLGGADAVQDATLELQIHQAAVAQCIRTSFESLVDFFDPDKIEQQVEKAGRSLLGNLAGGTDAAAWKAYRSTFDSNFKDRHRAFLTIYLERFGQDYETNTSKAKSESGKASKKRRGRKSQ